ncbi:MAG TPA: toast rack family protein [Bryobacteraceae bacterium]|nr:toast rack family protein [Bryobacteraceae bacterium]
MISRSASLVPFFCVLALLTACDVQNVKTGPLQEEPVSIPLGSNERANLELKMGAGEIHLTGGAKELLEGKFEYNVPDWKPTVRSSVIDDHASVTIAQPASVGGFGHVRYRWDLQLNDNALLDLKVNCGAGKTDLNLGDVKLRIVTVNMGAGEVDLDLRGTPKRDYEVDISGGVGKAVVHLPTGVGIRAEAHGGLGNITVTGLEKRGDHYENSLYDKAKVNVRLKVRGGIGEIQLIGNGESDM